MNTYMHINTHAYNCINTQAREHALIHNPYTHMRKYKHTQTNGSTYTYTQKCTKLHTLI